MNRFEKEKVSRHFDTIAAAYDDGKERQTYYYDYLISLYRSFIPKGSKVLDVGCGTGSILASLSPSHGLGIDLSPRMVEIAQKKFPHLEFRSEDISFPLKQETFDFVLLSDVFEHLPNIPLALEGLKSYGGPNTLYISTCANPLWSPILHLAEKLKLKLPEGDHEWISSGKLATHLQEHGFTVERNEGRMLMPKNFFSISDKVNNFVEKQNWLWPISLIQLITFRKRSS